MSNYSLNSYLAKKNQGITILMDLIEGKIQFFTIQFQLNLSGINNNDRKDAEYQYKLTNDNQEVFILPKDSGEEYRTIETWEYWVHGDIKSKIKFSSYNDMCTKPTLIQFITKAKNNEYENDFEISFRIKYPNNTYLNFEPLINDGTIIPNVCYELFPTNSDRKTDSTLNVILNLQKSFDISLYPLYTGCVIDEKDPADSLDPKYYEIYFKNQGQEYILYRSEVQRKKYRWCPFNFRYLYLANPQIFVRFFYSGKKPETPNVAPSVAEYIEFSRKSNSYKDFFKYKTKSTPIDEYLQNCCNDQNEKYYLIFPFIKKSPLNIQKVQEIGKVFGKSSYLFINSTNEESYETFKQLSTIFMSKIGFGEINDDNEYDNEYDNDSDSDNDNDSDNKIYDDLIKTIKSMVRSGSECCNWESYDDLIHDSGYTNCKKPNLKNEFGATHTPAQMNKLEQKKKKSGRTRSNQNKNKLKLKDPKSNKKGFLNYQVLFVYDSESDSESLSEGKKKKYLEKLAKLLSLFPEIKDENNENEKNENNNRKDDDIFSISGKNLKNINKGIYNLDKTFNYAEKIEEFVCEKKEKNQKKEKKQKDKENKKKEEILEFYSGFPLIIVTLLQKADSKSKSKFTFWESICNQYPLIKLICVKENDTNQYHDKLLLKYLAELKCIYDIFVKWTSQINFTFPVQMKIDPTSYDSSSLTPEMILNKKHEFIRRRLLELLSFDFDGWMELKGHFSVINYYSWKKPALIMALRDKNPKKDVIFEKFGKPSLENNNDKLVKEYKQQTYATILAAATSVLYHHQGGDPYAESCFIFALNWIKNQGLVDNQNSLINETSLEDLILNVNHEKEDAK